MGGGNHARHLSMMEPAHLVIFDLLEVDGVDIRTQPLAERRNHLEDLFAGIPTACPLALSMQTNDPVEARLWFTSLAAHGIEGLVIKAAAEPYRPGARSWWKYKSRTSTEAILGGVTGSLARPSGLLLGRYPHKGGRLRVAGRTTRLARDLAAELAPISARPPRPTTRGPNSCPPGGRADCPAKATRSPTGRSCPSWWSRSWSTSPTNAAGGGTPCATGVCGWTCPRTPYREAPGSMPDRRPDGHADARWAPVSVIVEGGGTIAVTQLVLADDGGDADD